MYNKFGSKGHKCIYDELRPFRLKTDSGTKITAVEAMLAFFSAEEKTCFNNWLFVLKYP
jgi:hypothetical protein